MAFSENLQYLRRKNKITQEQLADELGVTRQSVSKWETGEAYPETEKLIIICDKFDVSLDALIRGDLALGNDEVNLSNEDINEVTTNIFTDNETDNEIKTKQTEENITKDGVTKEEFIRHIDKFSKRIFLAVALSIICAALIIAFHDSQGYVPKAVEIVMLIIGALCGCAAIFTFIASGIDHESFQRQSKEMSDVLSEEEKKLFEKKFAVKMASLLSSLILVAITLVLIFTLTDGKIKGYYELVTVGVFLFVISFIIGGICYMGIQHQKFDIKEYNREIRDSRESHDGPHTLWDAVCGAIMLTATGVYLLLGFVWSLWHPGWVIFPLGVILCSIIKTFEKISAKK